MWLPFFRRIWLGLLAAVALLTLQSAGIYLYWGLWPVFCVRSQRGTAFRFGVQCRGGCHLRRFPLPLHGLPHHRAGKESRQASCTWPTGRPDYGGRNKRHIADFEFRIDRVIIIVPECVEGDVFSVKPVLTEINRDSVLETE